MPANYSHKFCVAPMLGLTDRHCRFFMRLLSKNALLYTEMVVTNAILCGKAENLLQFNACEQPLALQLGGSNQQDLAACTKIAAKLNFSEVNLNVGCPSSRVQMQEIGACLMLKPQKVASCLDAMQNAADIPITIKHRIGVDDMQSYASLRDFVGICSETGVKVFIVHARCALLKGLSPKDNRQIPPLKYEFAARLKQDFPHLKIILNGGISNIDDCAKHLELLDGVMLGRAAYHQPYLLAQVDNALFSAKTKAANRAQIMQQLQPYIEKHLAKGGKINQITRHILGLAHSLPCARKFRQILSADLAKNPYDLSLFERATELLENY